MKNIAIDTGFGSVKYVGNTQGFFPARVADFRPVSYLTGMEMQIDPTSQMVLSYRDKKQFIGTSALRQGNARGTIDKDRTVSEESMFLTMTALGLLLDQGCEDVNLAVGLPVAHYQELHREYCDALMGEHCFQVLNMTGQTLREHEINVLDVTVLPQPLGSLFHLMMDAKGRVVNPMIAGQKIGIVDIGHHTLDLQWIDKMEPINHLSDGYALGTHNVAVDLARLIRSELKIQVRPDALEQVIRSGRINGQGRNLNVAHLVREALMKGAQEVVSEIKTLWPNRWELDKIVLTGGGALLYGEYMQQAFERVVVAPNPLFANVLGYGKIAVKEWADGEILALTA